MLSPGSQVEGGVGHIRSRAGVFFDVDGTASNDLDSILTLFDSAGNTISSNDDGYDFQGFAVDDAVRTGPNSPTLLNNLEPALYADLSPGNYYIRLTSNN